MPRKGKNISGSAAPPTQQQQPAPKTAAAAKPPRKQSPSAFPLEQLMGMLDLPPATAEMALAAGLIDPATAAASAAAWKKGGSNNNSNDDDDAAVAGGDAAAAVDEARQRKQLMGLMSMLGGLQGMLASGEIDPRSLLVDDDLAEDDEDEDCVDLGISAGGGSLEENPAPAARAGGGRIAGGSAPAGVDDDSFEQMCLRARSVFSDATRDLCQGMFTPGADGAYKRKPPSSAANSTAAAALGDFVMSPEAAENTLLAHFLRKMSNGETFMEMADAEEEEGDPGAARGAIKFSAAGEHMVMYGDEGAGAGASSQHHVLLDPMLDLEAVGDNREHPLRGKRELLAANFSTHAQLPTSVLRGVVPPPLAPLDEKELEELRQERRKLLLEAAAEEEATTVAAAAAKQDKKDDDDAADDVDGEEKKTAQTNSSRSSSRRSPLDDTIIFPQPPLPSEIKWAVELSRIVQRNDFIVPSAEEWDEGMLLSDLDMLTRTAASGNGPAATAAQQQLFMRRAGVTKLPLEPQHAWSWNDTGTKMDSRDRFTLREMGIKSSGGGGKGKDKSSSNNSNDNNEVFRRQDCFLRALSMDSSAPEPWLNLGLTLERGGVKTVKLKGRTLSALDCLVQAIEIEPKFGAAWCALGLELAAQEQAANPSSSSSSSSTTAAAAAPPAAHAAKAAAAAIKKKEAETAAAAAGEKVKKISATVKGEEYDAIAALVKAVETAPFFFAVWYALGQLLLSSKEKQTVRICCSDRDGNDDKKEEDPTRVFDAANCFYRALLLDPSQASAWHHLALSLPTPAHRIVIFGRLYQTRDCLAQALSIDPHMVKSWCALYAISPTIPPPSLKLSVEEQKTQQQQQQNQSSQKSDKKKSKAKKSGGGKKSKQKKKNEDDDVDDDEEFGDDDEEEDESNSLLEQSMSREKQLKMQLLQNFVASSPSQQSAFVGTLACSSPNLLRVRGYQVQDRHNITAALTALTAETRIFNAMRNM